MAPFLLIEKFISYIEIEKRYSNHTIIAYQKDLEQFLDFLQIKEENEMKEVTPSIIRSWLVDLYDKEIEKKSINRKLTTLRSFFKWLKAEGEILVNPTAKIKGLKVEKRIPQFVKESELKDLSNESIFDNTYKGVRDFLMIEMFYQTGIRLSELINLKTSDVNITSIKVLGKRNKERVIPITNSLNTLISNYNKFKKELGLESNYFFLKENGNILYPKLVYRIINNYLGQVANLEKRSPHVLRHTFATHMLNNGAGLEVLKDLLGHANLTATQVYTHNSFSHLTNIYSQAHPRGHKKKES